MNKIERVNSLIRNNGVCMFCVEYGCNDCPKKIIKYCNSNITNYGTSFFSKERKQLAEKYLKKRNIAIYDPSLDNVITFEDLQNGDTYRDLSNNDIYIKLDYKRGISLINNWINEIHMPSQIKVRKIKIKIEEVE